MCPLRETRHEMSSEMKLTSKMNLGGWSFSTRVRGEHFEGGGGGRGGFVLEKIVWVGGEIADYLQKQHVVQRQILYSKGNFDFRHELLPGHILAKKGMMR